MIRVGVTGGIGSGKSTVCDVLEVLGVPVFRADDEGKRLLDDDPDVRAKVIDVFGPEVYPGGRFDRRAMAGRVFNDDEALDRLNNIVHPAVRERFRDFCEAHRDTPYVVMEAAILVETGGHSAMDHLVVVSAPEQERVRRVMARDRSSEEQVRARMRHQATDQEREAMADSVIVNNGLTLVVPQVVALHEKLMRLR